MKLIWTDLETTDLRPDRSSVLEIAVSIADLATPFEVMPVYHAVLGFDPAGIVNPYVREMHTKNGLLVECAQSAVTVADVDEALLTFVPHEDDRDERPVLAGSSVHFDKSFLEVHCPRVFSRLSHVCYDVSAVKLFCRSLGMERIPKGEAHRAQADIIESITHARLCEQWLTTKFTRRARLQAARDLGVVLQGGL